MQSINKPFLTLLLTPHFDSSGDACSISITQTIENPSVRAGNVLYNYVTRVGNVECQKYTEADIQASDDKGPLSLRLSKSETNNQEEWLVDRATDGHVVLKFTVHPRIVDVKTPLGPRIDLRRDQGGLQGAGSWFLPIPPTKYVYRQTVQWDLSRAPAGTRAVWTFGEGPAPVEKEGSVDIIHNSVYMVGPIRSYPPAKSTGTATSEYAGFYWLGDLPPNIEELAEYNSQLFLKMASFFNDPAGPNSTYRVFVRKSIRGYGGSGFLASYALEYDDETQHLSDYSLVSLLTHEMTHSWCLADAEDDGDDNYWYEEGIANLYSIYLPYRFGLRGRDYFRNILNSYLMCYYTNPRIHMSARESQRNFFSDWCAEDIPYVRGNAYLLKLDCDMRRAIKSTPRLNQQDLKDGDILKYPLDGIVAKISRRRMKENHPFRAAEWPDYLAPYLDRAAAEADLLAMNNGDAIVDISDVGDILLEDGERLIEVEQEILDFGFDKETSNARRIIGLKAGSRAALAGLREGDAFSWCSGFGECKYDFKKTLKFTIIRDGKELSIEFWPRSFTKAKSWQVVHE